MAKQLIRFDWAIKKLLKDKANFDILEGFLTVLLGEPIRIDKILEGESNKETEDDRYNRVDILVKNQKDEFIIIEVQNSKEFDRPATRYFHRMIYGTSKVISEYIQQGDPYADVKKVISITIAYFNLGQGEDYVYHGTNVFYGIHQNDVLALADEQQRMYDKQAVYEIFPEYWIIKADRFDDQVSDKLDEWIYFLKNSEIRDDFTAPGLKEAKEKLDQLSMNEEERLAYKRYVKRLHDIASELHTKKADIEILLREKQEEGLKQGLEQGREKGLEEGEKRKAKAIAQEMILHGLNDTVISATTGLTLEEVAALREKAS